MSKLEIFLEEEKLIMKVYDPYYYTLCASPTFTILDMPLYFTYVVVKDMLNPYRLFLGTRKGTKLERFQPTQPFDIIISAENGKLKNIGSAFIQRKRVSRFEKLTEICRWDDDTMEKIMGKIDCFENEVLKLTFHFECSIIPKLQLTEFKGEPQELSDSCLHNLSKDLKVLLTDTSFSDVELKCQDGSVKAHRNILSARSSVFAAMLQNDMEEKRSGVVKIQDFDVDVLKKFLHYIYTGTLPDFTTDVAYKLYDAGDKYAVLSLKGRCALYLAENLSEDNACDLLVTADLHSDEKLKEKAIAYILEKKIPSKKDIWTTFRKSHPDLASEVLTIAYEQQNT